MIFVFIIAGAIIAGTFLQSFEFSMIGAFLGFLFAKLQQLSGTVNQLRKSVNELTYKLNSRTQQSSEQTLTGSKQVEPIEASRNTNTRATLTADKSTHTEQSPIEKDEVTQTSSQKTVFAQPNSLKKSTDQHTKKPKKPDIIDKVTQLVTNYFTQGNLVVRVGAVILFFGVAFLLKYAAENSNLSMQTRLIAVAVSAILLLAFGWKLKDKRQGYGLILQGAAVGILYLTLFAAFRLYDMLPPTMAFTFMFLFSALTMLLAVLQNSRALATLSISGGFLAPVLTSTGAGSHVALFGYYAILNLSIFAVAWFKSWRLLNLIGFAFTFIIGAAWGVTKYAPEDFSTTEPFLILFFLLYTAIAVLFSVKQKPSLKGYVDGTLIFGLPLVCFSLQAAMVQEIEFALAWSSFATGAFYLSLAYFILKGKNDYLKVIAEAFVALGIIFVSLVIPFALDGEWTAASWAIEGAGLIWIGLKQKRWFAKYFGALIQAAGGSIFLLDILSHSGSNQTFFNSTLLGIFFVATASLFSSYQIWHKRNELKRFEKPSHVLFLIWGLLWWYLGGISEIASHSQHGHEASNFIWFLTFSGLLLFGLELRFRWIILSQTSWVTLALSVLTAMLLLIDNKHLLEGWRL
ncbi:MAG: DUF2339 domain-containing protein, partial [Kangiellaceae bacterium]|nr:DUF2339 domain-containing protein [Kangiellaceae bacterium]